MLFRSFDKGRYEQVRFININPLPDAYKNAYLVEGAKSGVIATLYKEHGFELWRDPDGQDISLADAPEFINVRDETELPYWEDKQVHEVVYFQT